MNKRVLACTGWILVCLLFCSTMVFAEEGDGTTSTTSTTSATTTQPSQEESLPADDNSDPIGSQSSHTTTTSATKTTTKKTTRATKKTTKANVTYGTTYSSLTHTLTVKAGANGSVDTKVNGAYRNQAKIVLKATPADGYVFEKWVSTGGVLLDAYSEQTEFYMPGSNATVTASFVKKTAATDQNGTVIPEGTAAAPALAGWQIAAILAGVLVAAVLAVQCVLLWKDHVRLGHADQTDR